MARILRVIASALVMTAIVSPQLHAQTDRSLTRPSATPRKLALVIGNNAYSWKPLQNAVNDAKAIATVLRELDFDVTPLTDADMPSMERAVDAFVARLRPDDVALFYFSGHGTQIDGENYLLPVGIKPVDAADIKHGSYSAARLHDKLEAKARLRIVILDACRDNPFGATRSGSSGLAEMSAQGSLIAFATGPGKTADDNPTAQNGLFTEQLLTALREPGLTASQLFRRVRAAVNDASSGKQFPWLYDGLIGDFVFRGGTAAASATTPAAAVLPSADLALAAEVALWNAVKDSTNPAVVEDFLKRYPDGQFRLVAQERLDFLRLPSPPLGSRQVPSAVADTTATISGTVIDDAGRPLAGVTVELSSGSRRDSFNTTVTDAAGQYRFSGIQPRKLRVTFTISEFASLTQEINVGAGVTTMDAMLRRTGRRR